MRHSTALVVLLLAPTACGGHGGPAPTVADGEPAFGTAAPGLVEAYDPAGKWMVLCQAREDTDRDGKLEVSVDVHLGCRHGDALREWLVVAGEEGVDLGLLLAVDPRSRFLVGWMAPDRPVLHDTRTGTATALARTPAPTPSLWEFPAFASFNASGSRLVYGRRTAGGSALRVRDLATGMEREFDPGPGTIFRPHFSPDGQFLSFTVVPRDSNGDGRCEAPASPAVFYDGGCSASLSCVTFQGDEGLRRIVEVDGPRRFDVPNFLGFVADGWVVPSEDGPAWIEGPDGRLRLCSEVEFGRALADGDDRRCPLNPFPSGTDATPADLAHVAGDLDATEGVVSDRARGAVVGTYPREAHYRFPQMRFPVKVPAVMGLRTDGALLRPDHASLHQYLLPVGPFRWRKPDPPK